MVLKDGKTEAIHGLLEQQQPLYLLEIWSADCTKAGQKASQAWSISEWWRHINGQIKSNGSLNDTITFIKSIFYNIWTEPDTKKGTTKSLFNYL